MLIQNAVHTEEMPQDEKESLNCRGIRLCKVRTEMIEVFVKVDNIV
jgi:hypothetical protein